MAQSSWADCAECVPAAHADSDWLNEQHELTAQCICDRISEIDELVKRFLFHLKPMVRQKHRTIEDILDCLTTIVRQLICTIKEYRSLCVSLEIDYQMVRQPLISLVTELIKFHNAGHHFGQPESVIVIDVIRWLALIADDATVQEAYHLVLRDDCLIAQEPLLLTGRASPLRVFQFSSLPSDHPSATFQMEIVDVMNSQ